MSKDIYQQEFNLGYCKMSLTQGDVLLNEFKPNSHIELKHVKEMLAVGKTIYEELNKKYTVCAIIPQELIITKEAREFCTTKEANQYINASAVVLSSLAQNYREFYDTCAKASYSF